MNCQRQECGKTIDREKLRKDLERDNTPETAKRAADNSVFCSFGCALLDFVSGLEGT